MQPTSQSASMTWLYFALLTVATWAVYGVLLHMGQTNMSAAGGQADRECLRLARNGAARGRLGGDLLAVLARHCARRGRRLPCHALQAGCRAPRRAEADSGRSGPKMTRESSPERRALEAEQFSK